MTPLEEVEDLLKAASSGSQCRTVASRAYYVTFRHLVAVTTLLGFDQTFRPPPPARSLSVHRRLFLFLRECSHPVLKRIGRDHIEDLFDMRVRADYHFHMEMTKPEAAEALTIAQDISDWTLDAGLKQATYRP